MLPGIALLQKGRRLDCEQTKDAVKFLLAAETPEPAASDTLALEG